MTTNPPFALPHGVEPADDDEQASFKQAQRTLSFAQVLQAHRLAEGWTLAQTGQRLGVTHQLVHAYETGKKLPSPEVAYRMGQTLGIVPEYAVLLVMNDQLRRANLPITLTLRAG